MYTYNCFILLWHYHNTVNQLYYKFFFSLKMTTNHKGKKKKTLLYMKADFIPFNFTLRVKTFWSVEENGLPRSVFLIGLCFILFALS